VFDEVVLGGDMKSEDIEGTCGGGLIVDLLLLTGGALILEEVDV